MTDEELKEAIKPMMSAAYDKAFNDGIKTVQRLLREANPVTLDPLQLATLLELLKLGKRGS